MMQENETLAQVSRHAERFEATKYASNTTRINQRLEEYNRLAAERQTDVTSELSCKKHDELDLLLLDTKFELAKQRSKLINAFYELIIRTPAILEAQVVKKMSLARIGCIQAETRAKVFCIKEIGAAIINKNSSQRLAEARATRRIADALNDYYRALIIESASGKILEIIASRLQIDPLFRFKLNKPLEGTLVIIKQLNEESMIEYGR